MKRLTILDLTDEDKEILYDSLNSFKELMEKYDTSVIDTYISCNYSVWRLELIKSAYVGTHIEGVFGVGIQQKISDFYSMRDKILDKEGVDIRYFLKIAKELSKIDARLQAKVFFELKQLKVITGDKAYGIY